MAKAYERKTPCLPGKIYLIDSKGNYFGRQSFPGGVSTTFQYTPDSTCDVTVEYLTDNPEVFHLCTSDGMYFDYASWDSTVVVLDSTSASTDTIQFTLLNLEVEDTFLFRAMSTGNFFGLWEDSMKLLGFSNSCHYEAVRIKVQKTFVKRVVSDPVYDTASSVVTDMKPEIALKTTVRNDSTSDNFTETLSYTYLVSKMGSWSNQLGGKLSVKASFTAGVPFLAEGGVQVTVTGEYSHTWEGSDTQIETVTATSAVAVPPGKWGIATVLVYKATIDVPFSYIETTWYRDGTHDEVTQTGGVYNNVESYRVDVLVSDWTDISSKSN